jgi:hypothetical protein
MSAVSFDITEHRGCSRFCQAVLQVYPQVRETAFSRRDESISPGAVRELDSDFAAALAFSFWTRSNSAAAEVPSSTTREPLPSLTVTIIAACNSGLINPVFSPP